MIKEQITLTGKEIKALAEMAGFSVELRTSRFDFECKEDLDLLETQITVAKVENKTLAHWKEYPEEGCVDLNDY